MTNIEVKYDFELDYTAVRAITKKSWIIELIDGRTRPKARVWLGRESVGVGD